MNNKPKQQSRAILRLRLVYDLLFRRYDFLLYLDYTTFYLDYMAGDLLFGLYDFFGILFGLYLFGLHVYFFILLYFILCLDCMTAAAHRNSYCILKSEKRNTEVLNVSP